MLASVQLTCCITHLLIKLFGLINHDLSAVLGSNRLILVFFCFSSVHKCQCILLLDVLLGNLMHDQFLFAWAIYASNLDSAMIV